MSRAQALVSRWGVLTLARAEGLADKQEKRGGSIERSKAKEERRERDSQNYRSGDIATDLIHARFEG